MRIWHMTADAGREPLRVAPGHTVRLVVGTSPIELGQAVWVTYDVIHLNGTVDRGYLNVPWDRNEGLSSYWTVTFGPFARGDRVTYVVHGRSGEERIDLPPVRFGVGPRLYLGLLWHQHQPVYLDMGQSPQGSMAQPWVRLHALRAYYGMPALGVDYPGLRVTFNMTPSLLWQLEQYVTGGATDRALDLTRKPVRRLAPEERDTILGTFFDADWHTQVLAYPRYRQLFEQRRAGQPFSEQDVRDLQMWANLAWFAPQFQYGVETLPGGEQVSARHLVEKESGFTEADIEEMVGLQYKIMAAIVPLLRELQDRGLVEVCTSPFYHPILPLLYDTETATIDRPGTCKPPRFHHPEDAEAQVEMAVKYYTERFGRAPQGMWPSEGAVSREIIPILARHGIEWIASDQGVLERSGHWGYEVGSPEVLCRPYRVQADAHSVGIFFRDSTLSNLISFYYHRSYQDMDRAAADLTRRIAHDVADRLPSQEDRILTLVLDGENTWCAYGTKALAFFRALYRHLSESAEIETVTFSEYLHGDPARMLAAHPVAAQERIYDLYTGSWIDEVGSAPGVDLGTWVGEPDENRAWGMLARARAELDKAGQTPQNNPRAFQALYMAEGSDWFWWLGTDKVGIIDHDLEAVFRLHLTNAYRFAGLEPPPDLSRPLVPWGIVWTFTRPLDYIGPCEQMIVRTNCPGSVLWQALPRGEPQERVLEAVGGAVRGVHRYQAVLGPFGLDVQEVRLSFRCQEHLAEEEACCVDAGARVVRVGPAAGQIGATWA